MKKDRDIDGTLRRYLLGQLTEEEQIDFEAMMLLEEDLAERIAAAEDELLDDYLGGDLSSSSREHLEKNLLTSAEQRQRLRLARSLKRYLIAEKQGQYPERQAAMAKASERAIVARPFGIWGRSLFIPPWKWAFAALLLVGVGFGIWRFYFYNSEVNKGIAALNSAFSDSRPTESRIVGLNYAPFTVLRGNEQVPYNKMALDRAGRILLDLAETKPSPASLHAVGRYYLAKGELDQAIENFKTALMTDTNSAQIHSDLGAAFLEKAEIERSRQHFGEITKHSAEGREHLEAALKLDPSLPEANFNLALYFHRQALWDQARTAWEKYLEKESAPKWREEAKNYLEIAKKKLQQQKSLNGEKVLRDFLNAYRARDDDLAWDIISHNREFVTGRLVFWQLSRAYIDLSITNQPDQPNQPKDILDALRYAGELEFKKGQDRFTLDLANYYSRSSPQQLLVVSKAHTLVNTGNFQFLTAKYQEASNSYTSAKQHFERAGDRCEMMLADFLASFCNAQYFNSSSNEDLSEYYRRSAAVCKENNYWWLLAMINNVVGSIRESILNYEDGKSLIKEALEISAKLNDSLGQQRNLAHLAYQYRGLGDYDHSLFFLDRCLAIAKDNWPGPRQMWRTHLSTALTLDERQFYAAAVDHARESLRLASDEVRNPSDPSLEYVSALGLGGIYWKQKDYSQAVSLSRRGYDIANGFSNEPAWLMRKAYAALQLAHLYRQAGDYDRALGYYEISIQLHKLQNAQVKLYESLKGRYQCYVLQNKNALAKAELASLLEFAEKHREQIIEERHKYTFFDIEQSFYDSAIDFSYSKLGDEKAAFDITEASRARSLLDFIKRGTGTTDETTKIKNYVSQPFKIQEILGRLPVATQVLQYAVLEDKLLIWFISDSKFESRVVPIKNNELNDLISNYTNLLSTRSSSEESIKWRGRRIYDILIRPIESSLSRERSLCIVPDKILNRLPFGAIVSSTTGNYLIHDYAISYAPSATIYILCSEVAKRKNSGATESILGVGNPQYDRNRFDARKFPDLPASAEEVIGIVNLTHERTNSRCYSPSLLLTGKDAKEAIIKAEIPRFNVLHFASHYEVDPVFPMQSRLLLAQEPGDNTQHQSSASALEAREIYQMDLSLARLAILSACQTGSERYYSGEGMIGISRVFIAKGVPLVIASMWQVDSNATNKLMVSLHNHRSCRSVPTTDALRQAQLDLLSSQSQSYRHPFYWAAFVSIGGQTAY